MYTLAKIKSSDLMLEFTLIVYGQQQLIYDIHTWLYAYIAVACLAHHEDIDPFLSR